jgi:hypothetical protein
MPIATDEMEHSATSVPTKCTEERQGTSVEKEREWGGKASTTDTEIDKHADFYCSISDATLNAAQPPAPFIASAYAFSRS